jgi:DNA-binding transcriptional regulator YhcF (GntR family)
MDFAESNPIYLQIADRLCDSLLAGRYRAGDKIPSVRELAAQLEVNPNTVQRTYATLQEWGIIDTRRGMGYFVTAEGRKKALQRKRGILTRQEIPRLLDFLSVLDMPLEEFIGLCRDYVE